MQLIFYFLSPSINQIAPNFNPEEFTTFNQTAKKHNVILNYLTCFRNFYLHGIFLQFLSKFSVGFVVVNQISASSAKLCSILCMSGNNLQLLFGMFFFTDFFSKFYNERLSKISSLSFQCSNRSFGSNFRVF